MLSTATSWGLVTEVLGNLSRTLVACWMTLRGLLEIFGFRFAISFNCKIQLSILLGLGKFFIAQIF